MIAGTRSADGLSGPIGIALFAGAAAERDVMELLWLSVFLSISLGLINLFPVPMLDGGHILFYIIEAVRGKPLPEKAQEIGFRIGFGLVAGLILFSTWNDLSRLKIVQEALSFFG
jgi:regulator of sigma E protease